VDDESVLLGLFHLGLVLRGIARTLSPLVVVLWLVLVVTLCFFSVLSSLSLMLSPVRQGVLHSLALTPHLPCHSNSFSHRNVLSLPLLCLWRGVLHISIPRIRGQRARHVLLSGQSFLPRCRLPHSLVPPLLDPVVKYVLVQVRVLDLSFSLAVCPHSIGCTDVCV
jgi:hypothetical protein